MKEAFICEGIRTPIGKFGGQLSSIRTDDLAALPLKYLRHNLSDVEWDEVDEVFFGNANQAGEDNRNIARMALLLAGFSGFVWPQGLLYTFLFLMAIFFQY